MMANHGRERPWQDYLAESSEITVLGESGGGGLQDSARHMPCNPFQSSSSVASAIVSPPSITFLTLLACRLPSLSHSSRSIPVNPSHLPLPSSSSPPCSSTLFHNPPLPPTPLWPYTPWQTTASITASIMPARRTCKSCAPVCARRTSPPTAPHAAGWCSSACR